MKSAQQPPALTQIYVPYKRPFDYAGLFDSYRRHRVGHLETYENERITRILSLRGAVGKVAIENDEANARLIIETDFKDPVDRAQVAELVAQAFDVGADPHAIAKALALNKKMRALVEEFPGVRISSGWDPFEVSINIILSQLVSVDRARQLSFDLIEIAGRDSGLKVGGRAIKLFPTASEILDADLTPLKTTRIRKETLRAFATEVVSGRLSLDRAQDPEAFAKSLISIRGVGKWTVECLIQRVLRHPDSFPSTDLIIARALEEHSQRTVARMKPWRSYAAVLFWRKRGAELASLAPAETSGKNRK